jgi:toxin ParE1/3/4
VSARLFAPRAVRELRQASVWIAQDNPASGEALLVAALRAARMLAANPMLGRLRTDLLPEPYRFWSLRGFPYLLIYNAEARPPRILRVLHMARDLPGLLAEFDQ